MTESKYLVLKHEDIQSTYLTEIDRKELYQAAELINAQRCAEGRGTLKGVFISSKDPQYQQVVDLLNLKGAS